MYFKVLKTSATGQKFVDLGLEMQKCWDAQSKVLDELGVDMHTEPRGSIAGRIEGVTFNTPPDLKNWKRDKRYDEEGGDPVYQPKRSTKEGKKWATIFEELPYVSKHELNSCIGYEDFANTIGAAIFTNEEYIGFIVKEKWMIKIPEDCIEVTSSEYAELFNKEQTVV